MKRPNMFGKWFNEISTSARKKKRDSGTRSHTQSFHVQISETLLKFQGVFQTEAEISALIIAHRKFLLQKYNKINKKNALKLLHILMEVWILFVFSVIKNWAKNGQIKNQSMYKESESELSPF